MEPHFLDVRRLLNRRTAGRFLGGFCGVLPGVTLALTDPDGRVYVEAGQGPISPQVVRPLQVGEVLVGHLVARGPGLEQPLVQAGLEFAHAVLIELLERAQENRALAQETLERYREINLLYSIGETISASLDPDEIPRLVLAEAGRVIRADCGIVLLADEGGEWSLRSGFGHEVYVADLERAGRPVLAAGGDRPPGIFTADPRLFPPSAVGTVLFAPLKTRGRVHGFVLLGRLAGFPVFKAADEKLLTALAGQAAVAMENARLFADVSRQRDAIAEMKNYMDNIFASIASGVITTDAGDTVTILNRAAERILGVSAQDTMGRPYQEVLPEVGKKLATLVEKVKRQDEMVVGQELQPVLPQRGPVVLQVHLSPLKDNREQTTGIAIVVDDLTERRKLEEQVRLVRRTFERYVPPQVVEQLLSDPSRVQLGGVRQEVTILFADIRGFTSFSERLDPDVLVKVLNLYLSSAADAVLAEDGTLDKFVGDAVMAIFNAPLPQPDHAMRAVRAALAMQRALVELHAAIPPSEHLSFGIGIATGTAVVGNVGSSNLQNYTAIGDSVNLASRLQNHAQAGQILLNPAAYERVRDRAIAREIGYVQVKGHSESDLVYELLGLREPDGT